MIYFLAYIAVTLGVFFATFVFFLAVMKLRTARDMGVLKDAPKIIIAFAYTALGIGLALDVLLNLLLSVVFVELPHEWLTTDRVIRLKQFGNDWQKSCARWMCKQLENIDEHHCR
jgi:hypothetical protein